MSGTDGGLEAAEAELARALAETEPAAPAEYKVPLTKVESLARDMGRFKVEVADSDSTALKRLREVSTGRYLLRAKEKA